MDADAAVTVTTPAKREYVQLLRAVARAVAARLDFTYDRIEDLNLVVDEACAAVLSVPAAATTMTMRLAPGDGHVVLLVRSDADVDARGWPPPRAEDSLSWQILAALADPAHFEMLDGGPSVRVGFRGRT